MRDITRLSLKADEDWIIASDISSGIGLQEHDVLAVPYTMVGAFAARVAMLEILCARGAGTKDDIARFVVLGVR